MFFWAGVYSRIDSRCWRHRACELLICRRSVSGRMDRAGFCRGICMSISIRTRSTSISRDFVPTPYSVGVFMVLKFVPVRGRLTSRG
ncbi:hypothetical protein BDV59DRAFT_185239 [Aspergillus ambiguus]|uniref:uncharacterized protein n=1 Tax=Aspergillus ambiguus TaxID=176160 RepID=UPI003CCD278A